MERFTPDQRSMLRYLAVFYLIWLGYFVAIILLLGGPTAAAGSEAKHLVWRLPVGAAVMTAFHSRFASWTPVEQRTGFWSFKQANLTFVAIVAATAWALVTLD